MKILYENADGNAFFFLSIFWLDRPAGDDAKHWAVELNGRAASLASTSFQGGSATATASSASASAQESLLQPMNPPDRTLSRAPSRDPFRGGNLTWTHSVEISYCCNFEITTISLRWTGLRNEQCPPQRPSVVILSLFSHCHMAGSLLPMGRHW